MLVAFRAHRESMLRELQNRVRDVRQGPDGADHLGATRGGPSDHPACAGVSIQSRDDAVQLGRMDARVRGGAQLTLLFPAP